jgi:DNA polymerase elongation subunit (family B)
MFMKRENIADRGIWTAKKRYILNVWDSEGVRYEEPKLKMMGIEAVKSSTPAPCRKMIKDALKIMMNGSEDDMIDFPHEIGLDKYIDHDLQFDKSFLEPLKIILDAIEWNVEKTVNLELFFS